MTPDAPNSTPYQVVIIGGGASGTALLYTLARYTNLTSIALIEKYPKLGQVNSFSRNNSQTLHVGDIESNYSLDKVRQVKPAAMMVAHYVKALPKAAQDSIMSRVQKMLLAVGTSEVAIARQRFESLVPLFPGIQSLDAEGIRAVEPEVMNGRDPKEPVFGLYNPEGYAVDFGALAHSFVEEAKKVLTKNSDILLGQTVLKIHKEETGYRLETDKGDLRATVVIVNADAYSLGFAKSLGYGKEFSLIPIAGTFYFSDERLKGKVYTMQEPRLPFAAVHGDPDLHVAKKTRWGPTARFFPVLESRKLHTAKDYFASSGLQHGKAWLSFLTILLEPIRFAFLAKNILCELPYIGKYFFLPQVQKIVPRLRGRDLVRATGYGGMRLQRVNMNTRELLLGEGKIVGDHILFNMTPSPGASVCLYNAMRDAEQVMKFFGEGAFQFDKQRMQSELMPSEEVLNAQDTSLKESYAS